MKVASLELCKELYELSGWNRTEYLWASPPLSPDDWRAIHKSELHRINDKLPNTMYNSIFAYDLGYLLRKLPRSQMSYRGRVVPLNLSFRTTSDDWWIAYPGIKGARGDTPEDAAANLNIELFKQGVLTRDS